MTESSCVSSCSQPLCKAKLTTKLTSLLIVQTQDGYWWSYQTFWWKNFTKCLTIPLIMYKNWKCYVNIQEGRKQWLGCIVVQWGLIDSGRTKGFCVLSRALWLSFIFTFPRLREGIMQCLCVGCDQLDKAIRRSWPCVCCCHENLFRVSWSIHWKQCSIGPENSWSV